LWLLILPYLTTLILTHKNIYKYEGELMKNSTLSNPNLNPSQIKIVLPFSFIIKFIFIKLWTHKRVIYGNGCTNETDYVKLVVTD